MLLLGFSGRGKNTLRQRYDQLLYKQSTSVKKQLDILKTRCDNIPVDSPLKVLNIITCTTKEGFDEKKYPDDRYFNIFTEYRNNGVCILSILAADIYIKSL